jgi:hypothetical protein
LATYFHAQANAQHQLSDQCLQCLLFAACPQVRGLKGTPFNLTLNWNVMPRVGEWMGVDDE